MTDLYSSITNDLIEIKKKYPDTQEKIYSIIDRIGKMNVQAQKSGEQYVSLQSSLQKKNKEAEGLSGENDRLKQELVMVKADLETSKKKLEEEQIISKSIADKQKTLLAHVDRLREARQQQKQQKEKKDLTNQEKMLMDDMNTLLPGSYDGENSDAKQSGRLVQQGQSLRRNSTSEPTSPR